MDVRSHIGSIRDSRPNAFKRANHKVDKKNSGQDRNKESQNMGVDSRGSTYTTAYVRNEGGRFTADIKSFRPGSWNAMSSDINVKINVKDNAENILLDDPSLAIGISYFNDYACLPRCLSSIFVGPKMMCSLLIGIDGPYAGYPAQYEMSTDGSAELFAYLKKKHTFEVSIQNIPGKPEWLKRQSMVDFSTHVNADFLLILDSDEYISPDINWRKFYEELRAIKNDKKSDNVWGVKCIDVHQNNYEAIRPRLWLRPEEMRYAKGHNYFYKESVGEGKRYEGWSGPLESLTIMHDPTPRSKERSDNRKIYELERERLEA